MKRFLLAFGVVIGAVILISFFNKKVHLPAMKPIAQAHVLESIDSLETRLAICHDLLIYARAKKAWIGEQMDGEEGYLQSEAMRIEVTNLEELCEDLKSSVELQTDFWKKKGVL